MDGVQKCDQGICRVWADRQPQPTVENRRSMRHEDARINFYGDCGKREAGTYEWHEYNAKFVHGQLVSIERDMSKTRWPYG
jgi:hypothetical protein